MSADAARPRDEASSRAHDVSVVVPTYRRPAMLERCVRALAAQRFDPARYEIIVCDDGPDDATKAYMLRLAQSYEASGPTIRYVPVTATQGPAGARRSHHESPSPTTTRFPTRCGSRTVCMHSMQARMPCRAGLSGRSARIRQTTNSMRPAYRMLNSRPRMLSSRARRSSAPAASMRVSPRPGVKIRICNSR